MQCTALALIGPSERTPIIASHSKHGENLRGTQEHIELTMSIISAFEKYTNNSTSHLDSEQSIVSSIRINKSFKIAAIWMKTDESIRACCSGSRFEADCRLFDIKNIFLSFAIPRFPLLFLPDTVDNNEKTNNYTLINNPVFLLLKFFASQILINILELKLFNPTQASMLLSFTHLPSMIIHNKSTEATLPIIWAGLKRSFPNIQEIGLLTDTGVIVSRSNDSSDLNFILAYTNAIWRVIRSGLRISPIYTDSKNQLASKSRKIINMTSAESMTIHEFAKQLLFERGSLTDQGYIFGFIENQKYILPIMIYNSGPAQVLAWNDSGYIICMVLHHNEFSNIDDISNIRKTTERLLFRNESSIEPSTRVILTHESVLGYTNNFENKSDIFLTDITPNNKSNISIKTDIINSADNKNQIVNNDTFNSKFQNNLNMYNNHENTNVSSSLTNNINDDQNDDILLSNTTSLKNTSETKIQNTTSYSMISDETLRITQSKSNITNKDSDESFTISKIVKKIELSKEADLENNTQETSQNLNRSTDELSPYTKISEKSSLNNVIYNTESNSRDNNVQVNLINDIDSTPIKIYSDFNNNLDTTPNEWGKETPEIPQNRFIFTHTLEKELTSNIESNVSKNSVDSKSNNLDINASNNSKKTISLSPNRGISVRHNSNSKNTNSINSFKQLIKPQICSVINSKKIKGQVTSSPESKKDKTELHFFESDKSDHIWNVDKEKYTKIENSFVASKSSIDLKNKEAVFKRCIIQSGAYTMLKILQNPITASKACQEIIKSLSLNSDYIVPSGINMTIPSVNLHSSSCEIYSELPLIRHLAVSPENISIAHIQRRWQADEFLDLSMWERISFAASKVEKNNSIHASVVHFDLRRVFNQDEIRLFYNITQQLSQIKNTCFTGTSAKNNVTVQAAKLDESYTVRFIDL